VRGTVIGSPARIIGPAPVIGLSAYRQQARWAAWDMRSVLLPDNYVSQLRAAGGMPVLLPPVIEAVELAQVVPGQHPFVLGVQWHPEAGGDERLMAALAAAASERAVSYTSAR
jgi:gamma-glutamyl-gamma-aminobutyrate hydrolase PuuD